jgi:hypothetical protein
MNESGRKSASSAKSGSLLRVADAEIGLQPARFMGL